MNIQIHVIVISFETSKATKPKVKGKGLPSSIVTAKARTSPFRQLLKKLSNSSFAKKDESLVRNCEQQCIHILQNISIYML